MSDFLILNSSLSYSHYYSLRSMYMSSLYILFERVFFTDRKSSPMCFPSVELVFMNMKNEYYSF